VSARRLAAAAGALLLAGGLAGCGAAADGAGAASAGSRTASPTARHGDTLVADMTRAMAGAKSARVTISSAFGRQRVTGRGSFRFGSALAADLSVALPGQGEVRVVLLPAACYLRLPAAAGLPVATPWLKIGRTGDDALSTAFGPLLDQLRQSFDPDGYLALLGATSRLTPTGRRDVDGVSTTRYAATVDLATAARLAGGSLARHYEALLRTGVTSLRYTLWVDGQSLPRKFSTTVATEHATVTVSSKFADWGRPVSIRAPSADRVAAPGQLGSPERG
jgi:hypothetical protein